MSASQPYGFSEHDLAFVRTEPAPSLAPPITSVGFLGWLRANLFSSWGNAALTVFVTALLLLLIPPVIRFLLVDAVWTGLDRTACLATDGKEVGACWAFVFERLPYFIYGSYPVGERWRVDLFFAVFAFGSAWMLWLDAPRRALGALFFFVALPVISYLLLYGSETIGLQIVDTSLWGGMLVTVVVTAVGIVTSVPIGIVLALGRRSDMPVVRTASIIFIEFVRGVPLITVLFMASVMLPLFVPPAWSPDKLLRALIGVMLFAAAYQAEVVRAGLEAIPRGQYEAGRAMGLGYWKLHRLIILPQALRVTIPNIVNSLIALFKDTTLVFIAGIFDFLRTIEVARADPKWATPVTSTTGYAFAAIVYFILCYCMARYADSVERRLARADRK